MTGRFPVLTATLERDVSDLLASGGEWTIADLALVLDASRTSVESVLARLQVAGRVWPRATAETGGRLYWRWVA